MSGRNASLWAAAGELPDYDPDYSDACPACGSETHEHEADCPLLPVPCRGCGDRFCDGECPRYAAWLAEARAAEDAALAARAAEVR